MMGIGPWAQGELIRGVEKRERARFRRAITKESVFLHSCLTQGVCSRDILEAVDRLFAATAPKAGKKPKKKRPGVMDEAYHGF